MSNDKVQTDVGVHTYTKDKAIATAIIAAGIVLSIAASGWSKVALAKVEANKQR